MREQFRVEMRWRAGTGKDGRAEHACSVSSPTQRDVLKEGMIAGFSLVPFGPMIGSRDQKISGALAISFFSIPVDMSSFSGITPARAQGVARNSGAESHSQKDAR